MEIAGYSLSAGRTSVHGAWLEVADPGSPTLVDDRASPSQPATSGVEPKLPFKQTQMRPA
jgi:hypothetical protein